ncbi:MAG: exonuclease subunit SbcD [Desulfonauticus sp.]|nr:exonuclease subunit SbcD [Desulfonauticus sp.]
MKILHTSDWHLGHKFYGYDRSEEFRLVLDYLLEVIQNRQIDILLVTGDIFDAYYPPQEALRLYYSFLVQAKNYLKNIYILAGNHDSISNLSAPKDLLDVLDIKIISGNEDVEDLIVEFDDFSLILVPYLREFILRELYNNENLLENLSKIYQELISKTNKKKIVTGHLTVLNSKKSQSEQELYIGKLEGVSPEIFYGADYVALGHLHRCQHISPSIVYSGSILKLSFDENDDKKLLILDTDDFSLEYVNIPQFRIIKSLEGNKEQIKHSLDYINARTQLPAFVEILLTENISRAEIEDLKDEFKNVRIVRYNYKTQVSEVNYEKNVKKITPLYIFEELFQNRDDYAALKKEFEAILDKFYLQKEQED